MNEIPGHGLGKFNLVNKQNQLKFIKMSNYKKKKMDDWRALLEYEVWSYIHADCFLKRLTQT